MTTICFVRHGETDWNKVSRLQGRTDTLLNDAGERQAYECGVALAQGGWDAIVASPLKRAYRTAEMIGERLNLPVTTMEEFIERSFGDAEGLSLEERRKLYSDKVYPNQESEVALSQRLSRGLEQVARRFKDKKVIVVSHGAVINFMLNTLCKSDKDISKDSLVNGCLSYVHIETGEWHVTEFNVTTHLSHYSEVGRV